MIIGLTCITISSVNHNVYIASNFCKHEIGEMGPGLEIPQLFLYEICMLANKGTVNQETRDTTKSSLNAILQQIKV